MINKPYYLKDDAGRIIVDNGQCQIVREYSNGRSIEPELVEVGVIETRDKRYYTIYEASEYDKELGATHVIAASHVAQLDWNFTHYRRLAQLHYDVNNDQLHFRMSEDEDDAGEILWSLRRKCEDVTRESHKVIGHSDTLRI